MSSRRISRRLAAAATATLVAMPLSVLAAHSADAATTTAAGRPPRRRRSALAHATSLGAASGSTPLRLTVGLTPRDRAGLDSLIKAQATPGNASYEQVPHPGGVHLALRRLLGRRAGRLVVPLRRRDEERHRLLQPSAGHRRRDRRAGTVGLPHLDRAVHPGRQDRAGQHRGRPGPELAGGQGLRGARPLDLGVSASTPSLPKLTGFYPDEFNKVYDATSTKPGTGTTLAVIAEGDLTQTLKDLRTFEKKRKLPQVPVQLVYTGVRSTDASGADEWDLDTQTSTGIASSAKKLYVYVATSLSNADLARSINAFAAQNVARSGSASLGECDALPFADGSMVIDDMALAEAAAQGQTFFASTGDTGSSCAVAPTNGVPGCGSARHRVPLVLAVRRGRGRHDPRCHRRGRLHLRDRLERRRRWHQPGRERRLLAGQRGADARPAPSAACPTWPSTPTRTPAP